MVEKMTAVGARRRPQGSEGRLMRPAVDEYFPRSGGRRVHGRRGAQGGWFMVVTAAW